MASVLRACADAAKRATPLFELLVYIGKDPIVLPRMTSKEAVSTGRMPLAKPDTGLCVLIRTDPMVAPCCAVVAMV